MPGMGGPDTARARAAAGLGGVCAADTEAIASTIHVTNTRRIPAGIIYDRRPMTRVLLAAVATILLLCSAAPVHAQKPSAERPAYAVGDTWIVNGTVYSLARIEDGRYVFAADG